jgi:putative cell wall-binding protein
VDNATTSVTLDVSVSEKASWKLYSDAACTVEISNQQLSLIEGVNIAYIKVSALDGNSSKIYTLKVIRALKTGLSILAFSIPQQTGTAVINSVARTISLEVTNGTSLTGLVANFTLSPGAKALIGTVEQVSTSTSSDFSSPVVYTIKAEDGKTAQWTVTVKVAQSKDKNILSFSLPGQTGPALIDNVGGTIDVEVNETADPSNLIATFELSSKAQAKVGSQLQVSGVSNNNYTDPLEYQVTSEDGSQKNWTVTVNVRTTTPTVTLDNIQNGGIITNSHPILTGKASKKSLPVDIYLDDTLIGSTIVNYYKEWSFTPTSPIPDGNHKIRIEIKDGNQSGKTDDRSFIIATASSTQIKLSTNPTVLIGDGKSTTTLEVLVQTNNLVPIPGISVQVNTSAGTLSSHQIVTGADGKGQVTMTSPRLSGVIPRQEFITARVNTEDLKVESSLAIQFLPASIEGLVLDSSKSERPPIAGAQVELKEDLNNDGVIDFTASTTTGADGRYKIYVPVGNRSYNPIITIPVQVGTQTISMQVTQKTDVGELSGVGETIKANQNISGKLMVGQAEGNSVQEIQQVFSGNNVSSSLLTSTGEVVQGTVQVNQDGSFTIDNVLPGDYIVRFNLTAPNGEQLASQTAQVSVRQEGEMSVAIILIDPYGKVTDETSGKPVSGVNMQLYWADTPLNSDQGRKADTLVKLPELPNFLPNRNLVPQLTTSTGEYAWMVFPEGDYYIVAEKSGYQTYDSRQEKRNVAAKPGEDSWVTNGIIHVGQTIVNYDLKVRSASVGGGFGGGGGSVMITPGKPVITLVGNAEETITLNSPYNDAGATAKDDNGVDITSRLVIVNSVTTEKAGDYTVTYNVTDSAGNVADQVVRTVHVTGVGRISGWNSVDTALEIAKASYTGKVTNVILATSENYPDALVASVLAYKLKAPILLVGRSEADQEKILAYLRESMNATGTVYISGGTTVVSSDMEAKVKASGFENIIRLGGYDRYETALKVAEYLGEKQGAPIVLAYGENYPDALSVSSAAAVMQSPILLVQKDGMSNAVKEMIAESKPSKVYIVGLQGVISAEVENQVAQITSLDQANIVRIGGIDRYETSLEVAKYFNLSGRNICLATGNNFPDALAGSVFAANSNAPIILVDANLSANAKAYFESREMTGVTIFGGEGAMSKEVEQELSIIMEQK